MSVFLNLSSFSHAQFLYPADRNQKHWVTPFLCRQHPQAETSAQGQPEGSLLQPPSRVEGARGARRRLATVAAAQVFTVAGCSGFGSEVSLRNSPNPPFCYALHPSFWLVIIAAKNISSSTLRTHSKPTSLPPGTGNNKGKQASKQQSTCSH